MEVYRVNDREDLREYEADKGLHETLKGRIPVSYYDMVRKWAEYHRNHKPTPPVTPTTSDTD
jgi:hypothetical protein